ncbi:MAG: helix-turn-helix transcriptional regulator [Bacteroidales bacterium]|jgi:transcriptional regulator with XRE-family HTH domain|nr:helix-turn-helix transcriptional regulator [Bacteroidales bacterium]
MKEINRLKNVLAEQKRTGKWLAEVMGKNEATVSRWCSNAAQPTVRIFVQIAEVLNVDVRELFVSTKKRV